MAAIPPPYVAGDSPPSYDEVASKVNQLVGSSPTPQKYLDVAASLSDAERKVLKDGAEAHNPIQTDEDKEKLSLGAAKTMSMDETVAKLKEDAAAAGAAVVAIDGSFTALQVQIASIDQLEKTNFLTQLNEQKKKYRDVLQKSRLLAADISQYGSSKSTDVLGQLSLGFPKLTPAPLGFDELIVPLCADQSLTVDQRLGQIDKFIARANDFQEQGNEINKSFDTLIDGFIEFTAQFSSWGKDKEQELNNDIKEIDKQLAELTQKLADLRTSLIALGVGLGVGLSAAVVSNQIEGKKRERQDKSDEIDKIRLARRNLEDMGNSQLTVFRDNVKVLQSYWTSMQADAEAIKGWLKSGADMANVPKYMKIALDEAVTVCRLPFALTLIVPLRLTLVTDASMAQYMDEYAKGTNL
ncbi:hypothetical protein APSETT444_006857 [Aspergillus pseudonomiae]